MNLSETAEVLAAVSSMRTSGLPMALATIVSVSGSTYRRPGARLLVSDGGDSIGNLSGGCLEGEVEEVARAVMREGEARLELYDLTADDEVVWGWGLGCNGAIEVLVEPAESAVEFAQAMRDAIQHERPLATATVLDSTVPGVDRGKRLLRDPSGSVRGALGSEAADRAVGAALDSALGSGETEALSLPVDNGELRVFVEVLRPPLRLLVCGAGHDAIPVVRLASSLGWQALVVDDRAPLLDAGRFPEAHGFIRAQPIEVAEKAAVDERTFAVVMSHNYLRDRDYLRSLLGTRVAYIGMLGPRGRLERLLDDLASEGLVPTDEAQGKIHGPAGLDVGADGPEEIAAAIVAEVMAVQRGRRAGFLRDRSDSIHARPQPAVTS